MMATQPPQEMPPPDSQPAQPETPPAEYPGSAPDFDQPSPGTPGIEQPLQM